MSDTWDRLEELFDRLVDAPPEERARVLETETRDNAELRRRLEAMLDAHDRQDDAVERALDGALHGFAIRESVEERTEGRVKLWPANLYGSIKDLTELELLEALTGADQPDDDQRRQYYQLTRRGRELLRIEVDRLQALVDAARASQALTG